MTSIASTLAVLRAPRQNTKRMYDRATGQAGATGESAESFYLDQARSFDPYAAAATSAQGQFNAFRKTLAEDIGRMRETQVGMGRLNSGWAQQGEDELVTRALADLDDRIMANANHAAALQLQNVGGMGQFGLAKSGMYYDLLAGKLDREQAAQNARRSRFGNLLGGIGAVAGGLLGGPVGAQAGGLAGQGLGGWFG